MLFNKVSGLSKNVLHKDKLTFKSLHRVLNLQFHDMLPIAPLPPKTPYEVLAVDGVHPSVLVGLQALVSRLHRLTLYVGTKVAVFRLR